MDHGEHPHPMGTHMSDVLYGLANRFGIDPFSPNIGPRMVLGLFAFVDGAVSFAVVGTLAVLVRQPLVFPSLGPTAFLLFYRPMAKGSAPRNVVLGHLIGIAGGYVALLVFSRTDAKPALESGIPPGAVAAAALSLAITAGLMIWLDAPHPPAAATTLIVSLGFMTSPLQFLVLMAAVVLLVVQDVVINRFAGLDMPLWSPHADSDDRRAEPSEE